MSLNSASPATAPSNLDQKQKLPLATPTYILRGHASPVHALQFYSDNSRLISGDSDGWVVVWSTITKRPVASWKAHEGAILGVQGVDFVASDGGEGCEKRIFTHGRDHALRVWRLSLKDEDFVGKTLPVDTQSSAKERNEPWLIHSLAVNALNFCPFASCFLPTRKQEDPEPAVSSSSGSTSKPSRDSQILLAVPNALNTGGIDIFHLPSEKRVSVISPEPGVNTGMVMAVQLVYSRDGSLYVVSGYEDGRAMVHVRRGHVELMNVAQGETPAEWVWERIYMYKPHSQPILSLEASPDKKDYFLTSSADALIVKHPLPLKSAEQSAAASTSESSPIKVVDTKHSGQQGLRIRSDEKIFVTAGWDQRARVYSCKTMKELAVLKWHKEGCYAIALADVNVNFGSDSEAGAPSNAQTEGGLTEEIPQSSALTIPRGGSLAEIKLQRSRKAQLTHWVAAGSKDGKVSLWDIY